MQDTMLIQVTNKKAVRLLHDMEELDLIKVVTENISVATTKLSDKYKGVFSKEDAVNFNEHSKTIRKEWDNI
jgi:hypothetical protein